MAFSFHRAQCAANAHTEALMSHLATCRYSSVGCRCSCVYRDPGTWNDSGSRVAVQSFVRLIVPNSYESPECDMLSDANFLLQNKDYGRCWIPEGPNDWVGLFQTRQISDWSPSVAIEGRQCEAHRCCVAHGQSFHEESLKTASCPLCAASTTDCWISFVS